MSKHSIAMPTVDPTGFAAQAAPFNRHYKVKRKTGFFFDERGFWQSSGLSRQLSLLSAELAEEEERWQTGDGA
ncbi:conserved hypothetical protein [Enterobacterales bacterium 8AC]|nr:conserved hypothetical protein [Enterobacterales bacterium 8AC]